MPSREVYYEIEKMLEDTQGFAEFEGLHEDVIRAIGIALKAVRKDREARGIPKNPHGFRVIGVVEPVVR